MTQDRRACGRPIAFRAALAASFAVALFAAHVFGSSASGAASARDAHGGSTGSPAAVATFARATSDTTPPVTTLSVTPTRPDGGAGWYKTTPTVTLSVDETATIYYGWDYDSSLPYLGPFPAPEGSHILNYYSVDGEGNVEYPPKTSGFKLDLTAPSVRIAGVAGGRTYPVGVRVSFSAADGHSGVATVGGLLDGRAFASGTRVTRAGTHVLAVTARDIAGRQASRTIRFTTKPRVTLSTPVLRPASPRRGQRFQVSGRCSPSHRSSATLKVCFKRTRSSGCWTIYSFTVRVPPGKTSYRGHSPCFGIPEAGRYEMWVQHSCPKHFTSRSPSKWVTVR